MFFYPPEAVLQRDHLRRRTPMCLEPGRTPCRASAIVASPTRSRRYCCTATASCWVFLHMHSEETNIGHRGGVSWSLPWAPPHQPAATSRRVCVVWCKAGGLGVGRRRRREEWPVEGKQCSDLPFLSVCPQLRAGTARSTRPADDQIFRSGWSTTAAERRASR